MNLPINLELNFLLGLGSDSLFEYFHDTFGLESAHCIKAPMFFHNKY